MCIILTVIPTLLYQGKSDLLCNTRNQGLSIFPVGETPIDNYPNPAIRIVIASETKTISPFPKRLPRTLRVLAMTDAIDICNSYRWIWELLSIFHFHQDTFYFFSCPDSAEQRYCSSSSFQNTSLIWKSD